MASVGKNDSNISDMGEIFQASMKVAYKQKLMIVSELEILSLCVWLCHLIVKHPELIIIKL